MRFSLRIIDETGQVLSVTVDAFAANDVFTMARERGWQVLSCRTAWLPQLRERRRAFPLLLFSQELLTLLQAGLGIVEALDTLHDKEHDQYVKRLYSRMLARLAEGRRLSQSLEEESDIFPPLFTALLRAGEETSSLEFALERYIAYASTLDRVKNKLVSASLYPMILLGAGTLVIVFLLAFVVPRFANLLGDVESDLPYLSRLLLRWGSFAADHKTAVFTGMIVSLTAIVWTLIFIYRRNGPAAFFGWSRHLAEKIRLFELSRLYLALATLLSGGLTMRHAMSLAGDIVAPARATAIANAWQSIEQGGLISAAFEQQKLTTPVSLRFLRVGERSGNIAEMMTRAAHFYDEETTRWLERFTRVFEPVLMAFIGLLVGTIVVLLYIPIFDLVGSLQ